MAVQRQYENEVDTFGEDFDLDARPEQATSTAVKSGWEAATSLTATSSGDFPVEFRCTEEIQIIKFLDQNGPFASYKQHFLQNKPGKKSYVSIGDNDPLITVLGNKPEDKRAFTIANLSAPDGVQRQMLIATPRLFRALHAAEFSPQGPLTKNYWGLSKSGTKQTTTYHLTAIKARDLKEDWNIDAEKAEAEIAKMKCFTRADIKEHSYDELLKIAQELSS